MPANRFNNYTNLGIGIGLRVPHYAHILSKKPPCDWFEIISENFMCDGGRPLEVLDEILAQYKVVQHGVSMYFGSTDPIDRAQLSASRSWSSEPKLPSSAIISAGAASMANTPTIFSPSPTPSPPPKTPPTGS